ncbi:hypothetical protein GCK72_007983 [Caenorhabditis remanei]|uniref:Uncharacterized protein n=1 Tax=Caenorhabditis remanei TaxID=31234 RepID=A0A6A5HQD7_CAERE|nr:hypothetical protein GCK72_007983 [Caenorhabditis remanei]KAF1768022.1 hypothetical protein GCK72_007983 [Caenorhabditis remanei]
MIHVDQLYGYSIIVLAAAPMATQLAIADIRWIFFYPIFAIPAITLMMTIGHLSKSAAVQTFRKLAPISAGIGWALTWHVAEKLYSESLRAVQMFLYILYSIRPTLSWAVSCEHSFNSEYCHDFDDPNVTRTDGGKMYHYPDNFWPAQEFNKFKIRHNSMITKMPVAWEPNAWYLGEKDAPFEWGIPSIPLVTGHLMTWIVIYMVLTKFYDRLGDILVKIFILIPVLLYIVVIIGLTGFGFHFTTADIQKTLDDMIISLDPQDFWANMRGAFRTSLLVVDYSTAFTGFILLATSRLRSGVNGLNALILMPMMMCVPTMLTLIRLGCEGHVADLQPNYHIYASTEETISFDLLPVCFATSHLGPVWSTLYFTAHYLYSSLGPMLIYTTFIYQSFIDDFPIVQNSPKQCIGMIALAFFIPSLVLYMPLGSKIATFFRYISQTSFTDITIFILVFFVYGWHKIEQDVLMTSPSTTRPSILEYFIHPTSPIWTTLQFTVVPMLLCAKFAGVFDFLRRGHDVHQHVAVGVAFLPIPQWPRFLIGYMIMFAPLIIMLIGAALTVYQMVVKHGLTWKDTWKPSPDWMSHASVNPNKPRVHSLAYGILSRLVFKKISYKTGMFSLWLFESFIGILLVVLFFLNTVMISTGLHESGYPGNVANEYRSAMLLILVLLHIWALVDMRKAQQYAQIDGERLNFYIAVATMEMAMLNGYMWMYAEDHDFGTDLPPLLFLLGNTVIRGSCILLAIAIRAHSIEHSRPSNTREASEVDPEDLARGNRQAGEVSGVDGEDDEDDDDSPVIFDLAHV